MSGLVVTATVDWGKGGKKSIAGGELPPINTARGAAWMDSGKERQAVKKQQISRIREDLTFT
jgi:hypothetical protein